MKSFKKIAVIGAGIAGLSCAYELKKTGKCDVVVYEKEQFVGGRMASRAKDGLIFDIGADHLADVYKQMKAYSSELGLKWKKVDFLKYCIIKKGKITPLMKAIGLISKMKLTLEYFKKPRIFDFFDLTCVSREPLKNDEMRGDDAKAVVSSWSNATEEPLTEPYYLYGEGRGDEVDEAVRVFQRFPGFDTANAYDYLEKKVGKEASDYLADAFTSTYQFHGANEIGLGMLFGIVDSIRRNGSDWHLHHFEGGMSSLPQALGSQLNVMLGENVEQIIAGAPVKIERNGEILEFDCVVLATTADAALRILSNPTAKQSKLLKLTSYSSTVSVSFMVDKAKLPDIAIVWVPKVESKAISGYVNESIKGKDVISDGKTLLNTWLHESFARSIIDKKDEEIFAAVKNELVKVCPWVMPQDLENFDLQRWHSAMPKFSQEHVNRVAEFLKEGQGEGGIYFCGDYMNSPWTEGALRNGQRTAEIIKVQ